MKPKKKLQKAVRIAFSITLFLGLLFSGSPQLSSQSPIDSGPSTSQIYLPFTAIGGPGVLDGQNTTNGTVDAPSDPPSDPPTDSPVDEGQNSQHQLDDLVGGTDHALVTNVDPNAGLISPEAKAAAAVGPPNEVGQWSDIISTPLIPIFVSLLPNGKVLMWDSETDNQPNGRHTTTRAAVWDPETNTFTRTDVDGHNLFCAGYTHLSDGRLFVAGGNTGNNDGIRQTYIFDYLNNDWARGPDMSYERWYPSVAALPNEELFVMGGLSSGNVHEVYQTNNRMRSLTSAALDHNRQYPFIQTAPDGRVLYAGPYRTMRMLDTNGAGGWQSYGQRGETYRDYASYAMYDIGKVIVTGGSAPATTSARLIDAADGSPSASSTSNMNHARRQHNLTILPDGSVLATGGLYGSNSLVDLDRSVYAAEVWNPQTGQWTDLAHMQVTRQYHSTALLLPDGRVLSGGGGYCGDCNAVGYNRFDMEIFSPPYLFDSSGNLAPRPTIGSAPSEVNFADNFAISSPQASSINEVAMVRLGAPTHSQNMGQRYIPLNYSRSGNTLTATAPTNANIAPPGYYMLFIIDSSGVPSVAKFVKISADDEPNPGGSTIRIRAQGQEGAERMELRINDSQVKSWTVSTSMANYSYTHGGAVAANQVSIHFTNDAYDPVTRYDHNLTVDKMILDGVTYESEAPTVEAKGVGTANGCNVVGFFQKELLYCNGYFKYDAESDDGSTIQVFAKGDEGDERIQLRIDGSTVASWTLTQSMATYTHNHSSSVSANQLAVHFVNDARNVNTGYDRNVTIDKLVLDGTTHQTEAPSVVGKGLWENGSCQRVQNHRNQRLHCNGYYAY